MIVKTTRWKQRGFHRLIDYIDSDKGRNRDETFIIYHNLRSMKRSSVISEFENNDTFRKKRKNGVSLYHEILSFHEKDRKHLTMDKLEDMARKYIEIRGNNALCYARPHIHENHFHVHFAFSGTEYRSSKTLRMDDETFEKYRRSIEQYQVKQYPELVHSIVYINKLEKKRKNQKERDNHSRKQKSFEMKKHHSKELDKDGLSKIISKAFSNAETIEGFYRLIKEENLEVYSYRDKVNGILYNERKYRFATLGIEKIDIRSLELRKQEKEEKSDSRRSQLEELRKAKSKGKDLNKER